jgi:carbonic anhydrase/acetyltransferase-like protein (isoleucine patch superfamily)
LHAVPWTLLYYFTPLYFIILLFKPLRTLAFWLFGYRGSYNFTTHPDAWLRDVPCLWFEDGTYLANKCTVAANMVLMQGKLLVDDVTIGAQSCIGMGAMVGPGAEIGAETIVDTSTLLGVRTRIGNKVRVNGLVGIQHGVVIEDEAEIGANSFIGIRARIGKGVVIPECAYVESAVRLRTQSEANEYFEKEIENLTKLRLQALQKANALKADSKLKSTSNGEEESVAISSSTPQ